MSTCARATDYYSIMNLFMSCSLSLVVCLCYLRCSQSICLDLNAPFQFSEASYCPEYSELGCCGERGERRAAKRASRAQRLDTEQEREICSDYSRNISCLWCSPLADRIIDSTNCRIPLCRDYCEETYVKCRSSLLRIFKLYPWRDGLVSKFPQSREELERDAVAFCHRYASDPPYCYPTVSEKERELTSNRTDCVCAIPVASGLRRPVAVMGAGDKSGRLFIVEQAGLVRIFDSWQKTLLEEPFLDIRSQLTGPVELDDLMNIAFHPNYKRNGRLYIYTHSLLNFNVSGSGANVLALNISEFTVNRNNQNQVDYKSQRLVFSLSYLKSYPVFDLIGGGFFFKDGYLFLAIGETEEAEGVQLRGQDLGSYRGKILRFDVDNRDPGKGYAVPPDNPFVNDSSALPEVYSYGHRMTWRCSIDKGDPLTGDGAGRVFCGDVGTNVTEEVNLVEKGGNYGYPLFEGTTCLQDRQSCDAVQEDMTVPINSYDYGSEGVATIGGHMYRGCLYPNLNGMYIYGDLVGGLLTLKENRTTGQWERQNLCIGDSQMCPGADTLPPFILAFGQDDGGEVYVQASYSPFRPTESPPGSVYQLADPNRRNNPHTCRRSLKFTPTR